MTTMTDEQMEAMAPGEYTTWEKRCWRRGYEAASAPQPPAEAQPDWEVAPPGATHYQPHQDAYYKRVSASEWYVWSRKDDRELMRWLLSPGTSDSAEWVVRPAEAQAQGGGEVEYFRKEMLYRCRDYAAGMTEIGAAPADLEAALAPLLAPPSAPVGVDTTRVALAAANLLAVMHPKGPRPPGPDRDAINELHAALAQQPVAVDGANREAQE